MQLIDKLPYGFLVVSVLYIVLALLGFFDLDQTRGYFDLTIILAAFALGYKLTEEYVIRFDFYKIFGLGIGLGAGVGIALFLLNAAKATQFRIGGGLNLDIYKIINGASIIAIEILYVTVALSTGSFLATLLRKEREEREGVKF